METYCTEQCYNLNTSSPAALTMCISFFCSRAHLIPFSVKLVFIFLLWCGTKYGASQSREIRWCCFLHSSKEFLLLFLCNLLQSRGGARKRPPNVKCERWAHGQLSSYRVALLFLEHQLLPDNGYSGFSQARDMQEWKMFPHKNLAFSSSASSLTVTYLIGEAVTWTI